MFQTPRMSPGAIQMLQTNQGTPVQPMQQPDPMQNPQLQALLASLRDANKPREQMPWETHVGTG